MRFAAAIGCTLRQPKRRAIALSVSPFRTTCVFAPLLATLRTAGASGGTASCSSALSCTSGPVTQWREYAAAAEAGRSRRVPTGSRRFAS